MLSAAALKARLDRMFLEMVSPKADTDGDPDPDADAVAELRQDLESLYSDIPSVAEMAAEQEYLRPVRREVENERRKASEGLRVGGTYVSAYIPSLCYILTLVSTPDSRCIATFAKPEYLSSRKA